MGQVQYEQFAICSISEINRISSKKQEQADSL